MCLKQVIPAFMPKKENLEILKAAYNNAWTQTPIIAIFWMVNFNIE